MNYMPNIINRQKSTTGFLIYYNVFSENRNISLWYLLNYLYIFHEKITHTLIMVDYDRFFTRWIPCNNNLLTFYFITIFIYML